MEAANAIARIRIGNVKSQILYDPEIYSEYFQNCMDAIDDHTSVTVKDHELNPEFQKGRWDGMIHLFNPCTMNKYGLMPFEFYTGKLRSALEVLYKFGYTVKFIDERSKPETKRIKFEWNEKYPPYDFQEEIIDNAILKNRGIIKLATGGGKCCRIDSLLLTDQGMIEIGDLGKGLNPQEDRPLSINLATPITSSKTDVSSHIYRDGESLSWDVYTSYKFNICGTPAHRIKVVDSTGEIAWKRLEDIQVGDYAVIAKNQQMFGQDDSVSLDDAYFYGLLVGDGNYSGIDQIGLTTEDDHIESVWNSYWHKKNVSWHTYLDKRTIKTKNLVVCSRKIRAEFKELDFNHVDSLRKSIPKSILTSKKEIVSVFIRGLYETDGWVGKEEGKPTVNIAFSSKKLVDQLHVVLLNFGIVASRRLKPTTHNDSHVLTIYRDFILKFMDEIGFDPNGHKFVKLQEEMAKIETIKSNSNHDVIPNQTLNLKRLRKAMREHWLPCNIRNIMSSSPVKEGTYRSWTSGRRNPSRKSLKVFLKWLDSIGAPEEVRHIGKHLKLLCSDEFYFDKVEIKDQVISDNYDFVVPESHSFVAQGFVNHNTNVAAAIIQRLGVAPFIFFVTTKDLMDQAYKRFKSLLKTENIGRIGDGHCEIHDINICTVQTCVMAFGKEDEWKQQCKKMSGLLDGEKSTKEKLVSAERYQDIRELVTNAEGIIFDEIHHAASDTCRMILEFCNKAFFRYGLGATVERDDGLDKVIEAIFGDYICNISLSYLIKRGFLIPPTIYMIPQKEELGLCENYQTEYKTYVTENPTRNQKIAQCAAAAINGGLQTLVLVRYIPHGEKLEKMINDICGDGSAILLHGTLSSTTRKDLIQKMKNKELKCIIATSLADEGLDIQCLQCLVLAGSGKSMVKTIQRIGRVIRIDPDNPEKVAIVYDFLDLASKILRKHSLRRMSIYVEEEMFNVIDMRRQSIKSRKVF